MTPSSGNSKGPRPPHRRLRAFAFDPILSCSIETHDINEVTIKLPWDEDLALGPVDDYLEVVDFDPASKAFYEPVDLNAPHLLAQDGLAPSESNPQFHQQMAFAVARTTINHFEQALGRRALWSPRSVEVDKKPREKFVERLRIYPHALREANAYYSPEKKALLFGYFPASATDSGENLPGGTVFACLSHDIVAHETTHALLDGLHRRFIEPSNPDVWALHEAFADIVALFQHFTYPDVLRHQIARTRGDLEAQSLLGALAYQFGHAIGQYGALRDALGSFDKKTGKWVREKPDPHKLGRTTECHARGSILVAAVFDAFLTIYKRRIADLLRIATGGTGVLPAGELHPDLVDRLAQEASKTAGHVLRMCIRALDYCPPADVDFGDYLRALITADKDLVADDRLNYRLAVIEAFRSWGIYPHDVRNLSEESLLWHGPNDDEQKHFRDVFCPRNRRSRLRELVPDWELTTNPRQIYRQSRKSQAILHRWLINANAADAAKAVKIVLQEDALKGIYRDRAGKIPALEVHSVRPAHRCLPDGGTTTELVIELTQRRRGYFDPEVQEKVDVGAMQPPVPDFIFRGGATLLVDPKTGLVRYCITKDLLGADRFERTRRFLSDDTDTSLRATYFGDPRRNFYTGIATGEGGMEPFALLHRSYEPEEVG